MMPEIEGKVASVLDEFRVALNRGAAVGVVPHSRAVVWRIVEITDPDTGDLLETVRLEAIQLEVVEVLPAVSIAAIPKGGLSMFGFDVPRRRIDSPGVMPSNLVRINPGDEVTIRLPDQSQT